jgi:cytochrome c-type biogenesis protein
MNKILKPALILAGLILVVIGAFLFVGSGIRPISTDDPIFIPVLMASALIDSVNPCAFSVLIISIAFLASLGLPRRKVLIIGGAYILGIFVVYLLIGLGMLRVLSFFGAPHIIGRIGAGILLLFGSANVLSYLVPSFPIEFALPKFIKGRLADLMSKATIPATFFLGALVALFEFPCTGGPYLMILGLLHDSQTYGSGILYLLLYNAIFVLPLVAILLLASDKGLMDKAEDWKKKAAGKGKFYAGLAMIVLAIIILLVN